MFEFHSCVSLSCYGNINQLCVKLTIKILQPNHLEKECSGKGSNINNAEFWFVPILYLFGYGNIPDDNLQVDFIEHSKRV